ncbi:hypothetical protein Tco_0361054, partial [Tanacetum coccineum]
ARFLDNGLKSYTRLITSDDQWLFFAYIDVEKPLRGAATSHDIDSF